MRYSLAALLLAACGAHATPAAENVGGTPPTAASAPDDAVLYSLLLDAFGNNEDCSMGGHCQITITELSCDADAETCSADNNWFESDAPTADEPRLTASAPELIRALAARGASDAKTITCDQHMNKEYEGTPYQDENTTYSCVVER